MRHWRGFVAGCAVMLAGCGTAHLTPKQPVVVADDAETEAVESKPQAPPQVWTYSELLKTQLPVTRDELDDLQADSLYSASVHGRLVWLDMHGKGAREQLAKVKGPVAIALRDLNPKLLEEIEELATHYPVAIFYSPEQHQAPPPDLGSSDDEADAYVDSLAPLGTLHHVEGMVLWIDSGPDFPDLRRCTGLKRLEAFAPGTQNELYERLPAQIEELSVQGSIPTSGGGKVLQRFRKLRRLALSNVREVTIRDLAPLKQLEDLELADQLTDADLKDLQAFPNLRRFASSSPLTKAAIPYFAKLPKLIALDLSGSDLDDSGAEQLAKLTQLEELDVPGRLSSDSIAKLGALKNLRSLDLRGGAITDAAMSRLSGLGHLESLNLSFTELTDASAPSIANLTNLRHLDLGPSKVGDETARALSKLTKLRRLDLEDTGLTNSAVPALLKLRELRELHVRGTNIDGDGCFTLLALPNLHRYYVNVGESDMDTLDRIRGDLRLIDFSLIDCEHRHIRLPGSECEDN